MTYEALPVFVFGGGGGVIPYFLFSFFMFCHFKAVIIFLFLN